MNTHDILHYSHQTVRRAVHELPISAWDIPGVCGIWSVRQIIAHLASYEQMLVELLTSFVEDAPAPTLDRFKSSRGFNDDEVAQRADLSAEQTWAEYVSAHEQAMLRLGRIPPEKYRQTGALPWYGNEYDLDDFIVYSFYGHAREHSAQIDHFRDHVPWQSMQPVSESTDSG
jgi:hypothetical protein